MPSTQNRKLAAILFADIVGYTALMQKDEPKALAALQKFKTQLETQAPNHKGEIIQFYGDGCLVVFNSSVDAVTCAKKLQLAFQSEPIVPVRIGLHAGDVVFKDDNVFGDAVNIASRVESMGIPGAVLLSSNVRNQIKNQPEFELVDLGKFEFKNVEEGMMVYALQGDKLAIPKQEEIKGKLKESIKTKPKKKWLWLLPLLLGAAFFGLSQWFQTSQTTEFNKAIIKERIAVLPFKNNTNNSDLDILGDMAADWINQGLMDIGEAEVVSPFTVRTHKDAIGILENDPQGRPSFSALTGAQNLITGNFYKDKDELIFKLEIVDALEGNLRFGLSAIRGKENDKEGLITKLREQIMGYWVARDMVDAKKIKSPKYEAYELYIKGFQKGTTAANLEEMISLDSTFYLPRLETLNSNRTGYKGDMVIHFDFLERHLFDLSEYEKGWLDFTKGLYLGKPVLAFNSLNEIRKKYPKDPFLNHETAAAAAGGLQNPQLALDIYQELPIDNIPFRSLGVYYNFRVINYTGLLVGLNKIEEANQFFDKVQFQQKTSSYPFLIIPKIWMLYGHMEKAIPNSNYNEILKFYEYSPSAFFYNTALMLDSHVLPDSLRVRMKKDIINLSAQLDRADLNLLTWNNFFAWLKKNPELINLKNLNQLPIYYQISELYYAGCLYHELGQLDKLPLIFKELKKFTTPNYAITSAYGPAKAHYFIGVLQTKLKQNDQAILSLKKAKELGAHNWLNYYQFDRTLTPLYDLPEFQELLQPILPEVKN